MNFLIVTKAHGNGWCDLRVLLLVDAMLHTGYGGMEIAAPSHKETPIFERSRHLFFVPRQRRQ